MKVRELLALLKDCNPDAEVLIWGDHQGSSRVCAFNRNDVMDPSCRDYDVEHCPDDVEHDPEDYGIDPETAVPCVVLWGRG